MTNLVVTDATCLIALERLGSLDILPALFVVHAPPAVVAEFGRRPAWLDVRMPPDPRRVTELLLSLDKGEAEAIALAESYEDARLLLDERKGRRVAEALGLRVTGTAGVLLAAKAVGLIPAVRPLLDALIRDHEFRLSERLYDAVLASAGER